MYPESYLNLKILLISVIFSDKIIIIVSRKGVCEELIRNVFNNLGDKCEEIRPVKDSEQEEKLLFDQSD